jgi:aspartyl-tRNA(Asn)/glutamyl-tRNA(Gln) amidotransferase subunit A
MTLNDLRYLSITEVAAGIRQKDFSSVELTKACLERINAIDAKLHSFITVTADLALQQAEQADLELRSGKDRAPCTVCPSLSKIFTRPKESARPATPRSLSIGYRITTPQP